MSRASLKMRHFAKRLSVFERRAVFASFFPARCRGPKR